MRVATILCSNKESMSSKQGEGSVSWPDCLTFLVLETVTSMYKGLELSVGGQMKVGTQSVHSRELN